MRKNILFPNSLKNYFSILHPKTREEPPAIRTFPFNWLSFLSIKGIRVHNTHGTPRPLRTKNKNQTICLQVE